MKLADVAGAGGEIRSLPEMALAVAAASLGSDLDDRGAAVRAFEQRTVDVRAAVPPDRLLVFEVRDGWGPLCDFLGVPAPAGPFPRSNDSAAFWDMSRELQ